jgi:uncharacterized repeat protein (TIGR01451 family)
MHVLFDNGIPADTIQFSHQHTGCTYVGINVYNDLNSNCTWDLGEPNIQGGIQIEVDSAGIKVDTLYLIGSELGKYKGNTTYTYRLMSLPLGTTATCPANGTITKTMPPNVSSTSVDFGVQCSSTTQFDLGVVMKAFYRAVDTSYISVHPFNNACSPYSNSTVTLNVSNKYNIAYVSNSSSTTINGNIVTWTVNNLSLNMTGSYQGLLVGLTPAVNLSPGDTVCSSVSIMPTSGDVLPGNNFISSCDTVRLAWDPNEKEVFPQGMISAGTKLDYTIHFENLGNDTAFNIHVLDTLSPNLDINSFRMTMSSHRVVSSVLDGPNNSKILKFDFPNIMLADSTHKEANKGFVKFSINAKQQLLPGTQITNRAGIYFDINPVVMTNEVMNWLPVSVHEVANSKNFSVYPNPTTGELSIRTDAKLYQSAKLINNLGQIVVEQQISKELTTIDLKSLSTGIYFIHLSGTNGTAVEKVQKQ